MRFESAVNKYRMIPDEHPLREMTVWRFADLCHAIFLNRKKPEDYPASIKKHADLILHNEDYILNTLKF